MRSVKLNSFLPAPISYLLLKRKRKTEVGEGGGSLHVPSFAVARDNADGGPLQPPNKSNFEFAVDATTCGDGSMIRRSSLGLGELNLAREGMSVLYLVHPSVLVLDDVRVAEACH